MKPKVHTQWAHAIDAVSSPNHVLTVLNNQKSSKEKKQKLLLCFSIHASGVLWEKQFLFIAK